MADPISVTLVATLATKGVEFFYDQAKELLKRWRDRHDKATYENASIPATAPAAVSLPAEVFDGQLITPQIHFDKLEELQPRLKELSRTLSDYTIDPGSVMENETELKQTLDGMRRVLEVVYQQPLRFKGEPERAGTGPFVHGEVDVKHALGEVIGAEVSNVLGGTVEGEAVVGRAESRVVGVKAGTVGPPDTSS